MMTNLMMMKNNMKDYVYEAIVKSIINDMKLAYDVFDDEYEDLDGVILYLNTSSDGFGGYLYKHSEKIQDFALKINRGCDFNTKLIFTSTGQEGYYPLAKEE